VLRVFSVLLNETQKRRSVNSGTVLDGGADSESCSACACFNEERD